MDRRSFICASAAATAGLAATTAAAQPRAGAPATAQSGDYYYLMRDYDMRGVGDTKVFDTYMQQAFLPAARRLGLGPVLALQKFIGDQTIGGRTVMIGGASLPHLADLDFRLRDDAEYMRLAQPFLEAPVNAPPFARVKNTLIRAMPGLPRLQLPTEFVGMQNRIFEIRQYEQPTYSTHERKVAMFPDGEAKALDGGGFHGVMYGANIVGDRLPCLTYIWVYRSLDEREKAEAKFFSTPELTAVFRDPKYQGIPSAISERVMKPLPYSQV